MNWNQQSPHKAQREKPQISVSTSVVTNATILVHAWHQAPQQAAKLPLHSKTATIAVGDWEQTQLRSSAAKCQVGQHPGIFVLVNK